MRHFLITVVFLAVALMPAMTGAAANGEKAPVFELPDMEGRMHSLSDLNGKVIIINFWASWCRECIIEMPALNFLYDKFRDKGLVVLGVTIDRKQEDVARALKKLPLNFPVLMDRNGEVFVKKYTVMGLPSTFILDRSGTIRETLIGRQDFSDKGLIERISGLLRERKDR